MVAEEEEAEEVAPSTGCSDDVEGLVSVVDVAVWHFSSVDGVAAAAEQVSSMILFLLLFHNQHSRKIQLLRYCTH